MSASEQAIQQQQSALLSVYLTSLRQRFKNEVNRLTAGGGMRQLLDGRDDAADLSFLLSYVYLFHWLQHNVDAAYRVAVLDGFKDPRRRFLMDLLLLDSPEDFILGYIAHWQQAGGNAAPAQQQELLRLLASANNDSEQLLSQIMQVWQSLSLFSKSYKVIYNDFAHEERDRYKGMLGEEDLQRLALVDALPDPGFKGKKPRYDKAGLIPAMGCPQTCRHCMFIWRPLKPTNADPELLYKLVDNLTDSVLFTGGDLTKQLDSFYAAIGKMPHIKNFAILLNGDFATDLETTNQILGNMAEAIKGRPKKWKKAKVHLQISFDEFHQEVFVDKHGQLKERIPVARIANIVESVPRYHQQIQMALLHKQTSLNFSMDVFQKGVFARLARELTERGQQIQILSTAPTPRAKRNPQNPEQLIPIVKDASFVLNGFPDRPIMFTSSTVDAYGRAAAMDEWETVKEKELLQQVLEASPPEGVNFDIDLMFWFNGWATLFNAVHICLGDIYSDGIDILLARQRKDPLSHALHRFDKRLLNYYREKRDDLEQKIDAATGPHHLFHAITEQPEMRLHMTKRLIEEQNG